MSRSRGPYAVSCGLICALALTLTVPQPAMAAPPGATQSLAGDRAFVAGDLDKAITHWSAALEDVPNQSAPAARLMLNLSTAHELRAENGGHDGLERAREYLSAYAQAIEGVYADQPERRMTERARRRDRMTRLAKKLESTEPAAKASVAEIPQPATGSVGPQPSPAPRQSITKATVDSVEIRKTHPWLWVLGGTVVGAGGIGGGIALLAQEEDGSTFTAWSGFGLALGLTSAIVGTALIVSGARKLKFGLHRDTMRGDKKRRTPAAARSTGR